RIRQNVHMVDDTERDVGNVVECARGSPGSDSLAVNQDQSGARVQPANIDTDSIVRVCLRLTAQHGAQIGATTKHLREGAKKIFGSSQARALDLSTTELQNLRP